MPDLTHRESASFTKLTNKTEDKTVDVTEDDQGTKRLETSSIIKQGRFDQLFNPDRRPFYKKLEATGPVTNMNVDGSGTPVEYIIPFATDRDLNFGELVFIIRENSNFKFDKFANLSALTNGVKIEFNNSAETTEILNIKTIGDLVELTTDPFTVYSNSSTNNTDFLIAPIKLQTFFSIVKNGPGFIKATVRDDLSSMDLLEIRANGIGIVY